MTTTAHPLDPNVQITEASNDALIEHILTRFHNVHRKQLRDDLLQHIHLENDILFHRVDGRTGDVQHG